MLLAVVLRQCSRARESSRRLWHVTHAIGAEGVARRSPHSTAWSCSRKSATRSRRRTTLQQRTRPTASLSLLGRRGDFVRRGGDFAWRGGDFALEGSRVGGRRAGDFRGELVVGGTMATIAVGRRGARRIGVALVCATPALFIEDRFIRKFRSRF